MRRRFRDIRAPPPVPLVSHPHGGLGDAHAGRPGLEPAAHPAPARVDVPVGERRTGTLGVCGSGAVHTQASCHEPHRHGLPVPVRYSVVDDQEALVPPQVAVDLTVPKTLDDDERNAVHEQHEVEHGRTAVGGLVLLAMAGSTRPRGSFCRSGGAIGAVARDTPRSSHAGTERGAPGRIRGNLQENRTPRNARDGHPGCTPCRASSAPSPSCLPACRSSCRPSVGRAPSEPRGLVP